MMLTNNGRRCAWRLGRFCLNPGHTEICCMYSNGRSTASSSSVGCFKITCSLVLPVLRIWHLTTTVISAALTLRSVRRNPTCPVSMVDRESDVGRHALWPGRIYATPAACYTLLPMHAMLAHMDAMFGFFKPRYPSILQQTYLKTSAPPEPQSQETCLATLCCVRDVGCQPARQLQRQLCKGCGDSAGEGFRDFVTFYPESKKLQRRRR